MSSWPEPAHDTRHSLGAQLRRGDPDARVRVLEAVATERGNVAAVARRLGVGPRAVHRWLTLYPPLREAVEAARAPEMDLAELLDAACPAQIMTVSFTPRDIEAQGDQPTRVTQWWAVVGPGHATSNSTVGATGDTRSEALAAALRQLL